MPMTLEWSAAAAAVLPTLQTLAPEEQRRLGQMLLELGDGRSPEIDEAGRKAELLRRSEDLRAGRVAGVPGDEVFRRAREQFR